MLTLAGIFEILVSLPLALFVWKYLFQQTMLDYLGLSTARMDRAWVPHWLGPRRLPF